MKDPKGNIVDIDIDADLEETGGEETEEVVLLWVEDAGDAGLNAEELAARMEITREQACDRLINLWENGFLRCRDEESKKGVYGRFFLCGKGL